MLERPKAVGRPKGKPTKTVRAFEQTAEEIERVADALGYQNTAEYLEKLVRAGGLNDDLPKAAKVIALRQKLNDSGEKD